MPAVVQRGTIVNAIIYAAKSTEDRHGSIDGQIKGCRALAEREGWQVVYEDADEKFSAFSGNRGPGLARVKSELLEHAPCVLLVQHTDRLARGAGDEPGAADHLMELYFWLSRHGVELWAEQSGKIDRIRALLEGERNTEDSKRKAQATREGLARRKERGSPVGSMPLGYSVKIEIINGRPITKRVVDEPTAAVVRSVFVSIEEGASPGSIARRLNLAGLTTKRGKAWEARAVRRIAENPVFAGEGGYPAIVSLEQADRTGASLKRMDPAAVQRRKGGRAPQDDSFILRGIARCLACDAALWTRRSPQTGARSYVCRHRRQGTRVCTAEPIPALLIEEHVVSHLTAFVGDAEAWALERVQEREQDRTARLRALGGLQSEAADLDHRRALVLDDYTAAVAENDPKARIVLEVIDRLDGQATALARRIAAAEAQLTEWQDASQDEALALLRGLYDLVQGRVVKVRWRGWPERHALGLFV